MNIRQLIMLTIMVSLSGCASVAKKEAPMALNTTSDTVKVSVPIVNYGVFFDMLAVSENQNMISLQNKLNHTTIYTKDEPEFKHRIMQLDQQCNTYAEFSFIVKSDVDRGAPLNRVLAESTKIMEDNNFSQTTMVDFQRVINDTFRSNLSGVDQMHKVYEFCMDVNSVKIYRVEE